MTPGLPIDIKEQVRSQTDLVDLIGETVALTAKSGGSDFVGLCPFHDDHNPSFHVYPERQSYRCWVCEAGGDCFTYVMQIEAVGFRDALEMLARRANIEIPRGMGRPSGDRSSGKAEAYDILAWAEREMHRYLLSAPEAAEARDYLADRGLQRESLEKFAIGYHPAEWEWLLQRARGRFTPEMLEQARLASRRDSGNGFYDYFVDRVVFPIHDARGRCVAFGGRVLPGREAVKYWNSPESEIFAKSRLVYGFDIAKEPIRRSETVVVTEGYTDCIMAHQHGLENVVATLGTALTETHVSALKRFAKKVVLIFDGDEAGQKAAERSLAKFLSQEMDLRILTLPGGADPADYLEEHGGDALREQIEQAVEGWEFKYRVCQARHGLQSVAGRERIVTEMVEFLAEAPGLAGTPREDIILARLFDRTRVEKSHIRRRLTELRGQRRTSPHRSPAHSGRTTADQRVTNAQDVRIDSTCPDPDSPAGRPTDLFRGVLSKHELLECELLGIILVDPTLAEIIAREVGPADFQHPQLRSLLECCFDLVELGEAPGHERVMAALEDPELIRLTVRLHDIALQQGIPQKLADLASGDGTPLFLGHCLKTFRFRREQQSHESRKGQLAVSGSSGGLTSEALSLLEQATRFHQKRAT